MSENKINVITLTFGPTHQSFVTTPLGMVENEVKILGCVCTEERMERKEIIYEGTPEKKTDLFSVSQALINWVLNNPSNLTWSVHTKSVLFRMLRWPYFGSDKKPTFDLDKNFFQDVVDKFNLHTIITYEERVSFNLEYVSSVTSITYDSEKEDPSDVVYKLAIA